eukprot:TRINITY_DN4151_c0_g5_i1.p1 TRINITY_DN4151_c0_g5~~TRINITY_DN4151_c0_g5_i1.p1  ORF type:complete len:259 (+),score=-4.06 TRINITY_DN4151_c0_g5_i1:70-846(+)
MERLVFPNSPFWTGLGLAIAARLCPRLNSVNVESCVRLKELDGFLKAAPGLIELNAELTPFEPFWGRMLDSVRLDPGRGRVACRSLVRLNLSDCESVQDTSLHSIMTLCPALRFLDISGTSVTNEDIAELAEEHPFQLEHLVLSRCHAITDTSCSAIALHMLRPSQRRLSFLNVMECHGISTGGLLMLVTGARQGLGLHDPPQAGDEQVRRVELLTHTHLWIHFSMEGLDPEVADERDALLGCWDRWMCCPDKVSSYS